MDWKRKIKERQTPARDIGIYNAYSEESWNDELLIGAKESEPEEQIEALVQDATVEEKEEDFDGVKRRKVEKIEKPMPRFTEADRIGDLKSLNRALSRTLYLVVKGGQQKGRWGFPSSELIEKESLHTVGLNLIFSQIIENSLIISTTTGSRTYSRTVLWAQHEYLGCRQRSHRPSNRQLQPKAHHRRPRIRHDATLWGETLLHESPHHGWAGQSQQEQVRP